EARAAAVLGHDLDRGTPVVDVDVDVAVEVGDVEELLEVVRCDLALLLEAAEVAVGGARLGAHHVYSVQRGRPGDPSSGACTGEDSKPVGSAGADVSPCPSSCGAVPAGSAARQARR